MSGRFDQRSFRIVIFLLALAVITAAQPLDRAFADTCGTGTISLTATPVTVNFDGLATSPDNGTSGVLPAGVCIDERGTGGANDELYVINTGSSNGGNVYSYGTTGAADRALGSIGSGSVETTVGVILTNNTGSAISSLNVAYVMEQWRLGETTSGDFLDFAYSVGATTVETGTWTDVTALDGEAVKYSPGTVGALNGNDAANKRNVSGIITVNIPAGSTIGLRWRDVNTGGGGDQGLSVDDLVVTAGSTGGNNPPTITPTNPTEVGVLPAASPAYISVEVGETTYSVTPISFTVADTETAVASLNVSVVSSNTTVLPAANLVVGGSGATRTVGFTAAAVGISTITITVTDADSATATYVIQLGAAAALVPPTGANANWYVRQASGSTAVDVGTGFAFIGDDENQQLRLQKIGVRADEPQYFLDVTANLNLTDISGGTPREVDIEASTRVGNTIYWMASHSNSSGGSLRPNRSRLFSTTVTGSGSTATLAFGGYTDQLRSALLTWDSSNAHGLGANFFGLTASAASGVAPESAGLNGFNIEGFTVAPDGTTFYIGFRAPIVPASDRTKALIVPVTNVTALTTGTPSAVAPVFGTPIQLNLGGRGIRSIECAIGGQCLIVAGSATSANAPRLFTWTGNAVDAPVERAANLSGYNPEGIIFATQPFTDGSGINLLSDDGDNQWYGNGVPNQELITQVGWRRVRTLNVALGAAVSTNAPVLPTCPATLNVAAGATGSASLTATDTDGTVTGATITSAAVTGISLGTVTPASSVGGTLSVPLNVGSTTAPGTYNVVVRFSNNDATPQTADCTIAVTVQGTRIYTIQGAAHISPLLTSATGRVAVSNVPGVVTAVDSNGFFMQDATGDGDIATSDGIFVFTSSAPTVTVGQTVSVSGAVSEFLQTGAANVNNLRVTQIAGSTSNPNAPLVVTVTGAGTVPTPIVIGTGGRIPPNSVIDDDNLSSFDPTTDGIDFYESLESMRVQVNNPRAVSPTNSFGEIFVVADNGANATGLSARGSLTISPTDFNPERIQIDDDAPITTGTTPNVNVGALLNSVTGILYYSFSNFELLVQGSITVQTASTLTPEVTTLTKATDKLVVATYNVENLDPGDSTFAAHADRIVDNLLSPDILLLQEIQDNNGATNDSVVDASTTFNQLISAISATGGPTYQFRQINPVDDTNGGEPGGNIRTGFLFNPARVTFVDRAGGTATANTTVTCTSGTPSINFSPGLIDPTNTAFNSSRKPLVGEFVFAGRTLFIINNHWNSKGGDFPLFGAVQPPTLTSEAQRVQQATIVKNFVTSLRTCNPNAYVIVGGDLNDFQFSPPLQQLTSIGLVPMVTLLPEVERYSYNFQGNAQVLDQIVVTPNLIAAPVSGEFDAVHINAEFFNQISDHDASVARFTFGAVQVIRPDTPALYNRQNAFFLLRNFNSTGPTTYAFPFGPANDSNIVPLIGDWNGDNIDTVGIYNRANSSFILSNDNATVAASFPYGTGGSNLVPIVGDWDGNGTDTAGLYNPANGAWLLINVNASSLPQVSFLYGPGGANLVPIPGDWDGDGDDTPGLFNTTNGAWILANAQNAAPFASFPYGDGTLSPVKGDWDGNGTDTPGHYNPVNGAWLLINQNASVAPELTFIYGVSPQGNTLIARAGKWPAGGSGGSVAPDTTPDEPQIAPTFAP